MPKIQPMDLAENFENFMRLLPSIELIDEMGISSNGPRRADYLGLGRKIIFEQKAITTDQIEKIQDEVDKLKENESFPIFVGKIDINLILEKLPDALEIKKKIYFKITKSFEGYLSSANKQIASTAEVLDIPRPIGVLIILNDKIQVLSPEIIVQRLFERSEEKKKDGCYRFNNINYILIISETHTDKGLYPVMLVDGPNYSAITEEVEEYLDYLLSSWASFNAGFIGKYEINPNKKLLSSYKKTRTNTDSEMPRHKYWEYMYKRNRYMEKWSNDEVLKHGNKISHELTELYKKSKEGHPDERINKIREFNDFITETNLRGLDLRG